jgi:hypothetical protein
VNTHICPIQECTSLFGEVKRCQTDVPALIDITQELQKLSFSATKCSKRTAYDKHTQALIATFANRCHTPYTGRPALKATHLSSTLTSFFSSMR